jgi:tRNA(Phe) wybutosine-synthesizing methylase Tyw3
LRYARSIGFKRSGIIESSRRIIVEVLSTEKVDTPINSELSSKYLKKIVDESNKRFEQNSKRVKKLYKFFRKK